MTSSATPVRPATHFLATREGRIAYDVQGDAPSDEPGRPTLVMLPGMGELRSTYRHLTPLLVDAGYRVVTADLRGHGESDAGFSSYGDAETADDLVALLRHLDTPAVVVGNSMSAGAAVITAARHPELVSGLVLVGPFVRNPVTASALQRALFRVMMAPLWARQMWNGYLPTLYSGRKPDDFAEYRRQVSAAMKRPGYTRSFSLTTRTSHAEAEALLGSVHTPTLVVMGASDPDFPNPAAEAEWVRAALQGTSVLIDDAGHYPHAQQPEQTASAITAFLAEGRSRA
ncbi:alpha/beta hydrolase [Herbiconiux sp. KACC 21604]|uniref:alpha/beta fold hydrolase n=1 Tax=unclassified Herbiconiux TaxID=2618217 RepID=UPI0014931198|nr:alpha/beta hydrolase [Herbiconiux sp. SALV-R1]QJU52734.1 alpha/beta hydrolase [Herbiconiux sp. SALV-R1]WPO87635.1 alpha/beta hydrolase [Herbiconiux sp. KACC 21604]